MEKTQESVHVSRIGCHRNWNMFLESAETGIGTCFYLETFFNVEKHITFVENILKQLL